MAWTPPDTDEFIPPDTDEIVSGTTPPPQQPSVGFGTAFAAASAMAPWNRVRAATTDPLGEKVAEVGGQMGYPTAGAVAGTAVQMSPDLLALYTGRQGLYNPQNQNPTMQGLLNTPKELGASYGAQDAALGVARRPVPTGGNVPRYAPFERVAATKQPTPVMPAEPLPSNIPTSYPSQPARFMSYAEQRLAGEKPVNLQELKDWQVKLQTDIASGTIPKIDPSTGRTTTVFQAASDLGSRVGKRFNEVADPVLASRGLQTRTSLNQANRVSNIQEAVKRGLWRGAKWTGAVVAGGFGVNSIVDKFTAK